MPRDQKDKFNRILESTIDGLSEFAGVLDDLGKQSTMMLKLLNKSIKELRGIKLKKGTVVIEEPKQAAKPILGIRSKTNAREKAASLLFNMLSTKPGIPDSPGAISATPTGPTKGLTSGPPKGPTSGPPKGPPKKGPPSGPPTGPPKKGPPSGPPTGPPKKGPAKSPSGKPGLPPPPKLPPATGASKGPTNIAKPPSITRGPPGSPPPGAAPAASSPSPPSGGSSLGSLRDEMLKELDRLKKIMRGG